MDFDGGQPAAPLPTSGRSHTTAPVNDHGDPADVAPSTSSCGSPAAPVDERREQREEEQQALRVERRAILTRPATHDLSTEAAATAGSMPRTHPATARSS